MCRLPNRREGDEPDVAEFNLIVMPIIKSHEASAVIKNAVVLDMGDLRREAARLLSTARAQARQVSEKARQEGRRIAAKAYEQAFEEAKEAGMEKGRAEGVEEGRDLAHQQWSGKLEALEKAWLDAARSWESQRKQIDRESRQAVLELAILLARKVIHRAIEVEDKIIVDQVKAAMDHVLQPLDVTIRIHGDDRPVLESAMPELVEQITGLAHVQLVDDPAVDRAGCIVCYGEGRVDATVETQLRRLVETIMPDRGLGDRAIPIQQSEEPS